MTRILSVFLSIVVILIIAFGCSSGNSNPVTSQKDSTIDSPLILPETNADNSSRTPLGMWTLHFDTESLTASLEPNRELNRHYSVRSHIEPPVITVTYWDPVTETVHVNVTIKNSSFLNVFDVRLIIYTDDAGHTLSNADGMTGLWDIPDGLPFNPFMAYAKTATRRNFQAQAEFTENLQIYCPDENFNIQFAIDASYPGNCEEPYAFENFTQGVLYDTPGSQATVTIDVLDWQDDVNEVYLHCPSITGPALLPFDNAGGSTWQLDFVNSIGANHGEYKAWLLAKSANSGSLALYNSVIITVTPYSCTPLNPQIVGAIYYLNECLNVTVKGNYAYIGDEDTGLNIVDISDPSEPEVIGNIAPNNTCIDIAVTIRGNYAYVSDGDEFKIIDISNPQKPVTIGNVSIRYADDIAVWDNYAYVLYNTINEIKIVDISDLYNPEIVGTTQVNDWTNAITIENGLLYAGDNHGISIFDLNDPVHPQIIGSFETEDSVKDIEVSGDLAYIAIMWHNLVIADISNPEDPQEVGSLSFSDPEFSPKDITISGDLAYIAARKSMLICDISDPSNPQEIGVFETDGSARGIDVSGNLAFIADGGHGFAIVDITDPQAITEIGAVYEGTVANSIAVSGNYAYVAHSCHMSNTMSQGLTTIDISNPQEPKTVAAVHECYWAKDVVVEGNYAYIAAGFYLDEHNHDGAFYIVDITDPVNPVKVSNKWLEVGYGVAVSGDYACIADRKQGLKIFDVHNPFNPQRIGSCIPAELSKGVAIKDNYIYVASWDDGLAIVDGSNPTSPEILSLTDMDGYTVDVAVSGNLAYIANEHISSSDAGFSIVDVSNPTNPEILSNTDTGDAKDIEVSGSYAYIADGYEGLKIFDISDSYNPVFYSSLDTHGFCCNVIVVENYAYIANGLFGVRIIKLW